MTIGNTQNRFLLVSLVTILFIPCMIGSNPSSISNQNTPTTQQVSFFTAGGTEDYVDSDASDVDISPDFGTHSSFVSQQAGLDAAYDTLLEENTAPPPTDSENDVDNDNSDVDSSPDVGVEGTFSNAQGTGLDSSYLNLQEDTASLGYGGELGSVFVTGSLPDMADKDQLCRYQAIFWNPSDDIYEITRVEFNYTGSQWAKSISQGAGLSFPLTGWAVAGRMVVYWTGATPLYVQPHDVYPFHISAKSNRINLDFNIDIRITANGTVHTASYHSEQGNGNFPGAQVWLGSSLPPEQNHSVAVSTETTVYVTLEEDAGKIQIDTGGTLTIDVPAEFTSITDIGGTGWGTATITGNRIEISNTATVQGDYITYAFNVTAPIFPGLYMLNIAYDGTSGGQPYAHPIGNFTLHVVGAQPTSEQIDVEYQWTTADYDEANEQLCIYVATHTGSEDLMINFWNGSGWENIGSITSTGWTNLTITGLTSATYTIQLLGGSEASDSNKDIWDVDLITLHVWSLQTYNYELDLEIQWTSAIYTGTNEELCIYAGSLNAESIRVDVWTGSDWTNVLADLVENSWNNISVGTWLTSELFTIRFRGDLETGDTSQSSWQIDCSLLSTWTNEVPLNDAAPTISNLDDSSYMYAMYRKYQITVYVADGDGYADIDYLELTLTTDDQLTEFWTIRYDEDTGLFTEQSDPSDYISLDGAASSSVTSGNSLNATFHLAINWNHPNISNSDAKCYVMDDDTSSSLDYYEVNWNVEPRLDMVAAPVLDDGSGTPTRGDTDGSIDASGTVTYLGSSLHPSASEIDIWISASEYGSQEGPWEATNYEASGGTFSVQVYADDTVGQDTFNFKAVEAGTGSGGLDQFNSSESVLYIADRVQVQVYASDDSRLNIGDTASVHVTLYYDYDDSNVVDGTVTVNGLVATYSGSNGVWDYTDTKSTVQMVTYNTVAFSGGVHGITVEDQNGQSLEQIWDRIQVVSYSASDNRLDVDTAANIDVLLRYEYDSTAVTNGLVTVNGISATHQGAGVWRIADTKSTVQLVTYNVVVASGNAYGISSVDQNGQSQSVIWDQITVLSYFVLDDRVNLSDVVNIDVTLQYNYDNSPVIDGVVVINSVSATHLGGGVWNITESKSTVQGVNYTNVVCSGNTYGITDVNQNSQFEFVIWDRVVVRYYTVSDARVDINDAVNIDVAIEYEFDNTSILNGFVTVNSISATHQGGGVWRIIESRSSVQSQTYDTVACSGNLHGITTVNQDLKSQTVIWDQIAVRSYTVIDSRVDVGTSVNIDVTIEYEYDDTPVIDGTVTINSLSATGLGGGIWRVTELSASVVGTTYDAVACAGNTHGVSSIDQNGESVLVIWDRIIVASYSVLDSRVGINTAVDVNVTLQYEYDSSPVIDGTVAINSVSATHLASGVWRISESKSSVTGFTYDTVSCSGNLHGITNVNQNSQSQTVIWDRIIVLSYAVNDNRVNWSTSVNIDVTIQYEYDSSAVVVGTVTVNSVSATHQGSGVWRIVELYGSVQGQTYDSVSCSGNIHGISTVNQNGQSQLVIWDKITVRSYEVSDARDNVGDTITVTVELEYEYDDTDVTDGTVTINLVAFTYTGSLGKWSADRSQSTVMDETYDTVLVSGNTHGITIVDQNGQLQVIVWDRIQVLTTTVSDGRVGVGSSCEIRVTLWLEYDSTFLGSGDTVTLDDTSMTWNATNSWFTLSRQQAIVGKWTYFVNSSFHTSYGISVLDLNAQETNVTWDQVIVLAYAVLDNRVNVDDLVNVDVTLEYEFDDTPVLDGVVTINSVSATNQGGGVWRITVVQSSVQSVNYDTVACSANANGISSVNQNSQSHLVIWDRVTVRGYQASDPRDDVGDTITVTVELEYEYDDTDVVDGTVTINSISFTYTGSSGMWSADRTQSSIMDETYDTVVVAGNGYGITSVDQNGESQVIVWDRIQVLSSTADDSRLNIGTSTEIRITLWLEYDGTFLGSGDSVTLDGFVMAWNATNSWFTLSRQKATVGSWVYFVNSSSQTTYGISALDLNAQSVSVIWDRIAVQGYTVGDSRVNLNDNVDVDVTLMYEFDSTQVTDGTVTINGASAAYQGAGVWRAVESRGSVVDVTYNNVACGVNSHGISIVNQNGTSQLVIWDEVVVRGYQVTDARDNIGDTITITVELEYEYDDTDVVDGTVTINSISFTYTGSSGMWSADRTQSSVMDETYDTVVVAGNAYGITTVAQNGQSQVIIWDRIQVFTTTVDDGRISIGASCEVRVTLRLEYDGTFLGSGDSVSVDGTSMTWNATNSWFTFSRQRGTVGGWIFFVNTSSQAAFDITALDLNSQQVEIVWDKIIISTTTVDDDRTNVDTPVETRVTAALAYDGHTLQSGDTIVLDGSTMVWDSTNLRFNLTRSKSIVGLWSFQVQSALEATYGISVVDLDGHSQDVIWDRLSIYIQADSDLVENGVQVNFTMTVTYEYDSVTCNTYSITIDRNASYWNTFTNGNVSLFIDSSTDSVYEYVATQVLAESTYGITAFTSNTETVNWGGIAAAPVNESAPALKNPDDTDFMHAKIRFYTITSNVSDGQGYSDIDYVELSLWDNTQTTEIWRVRYTESTNTFTIEIGSAYIQLASWSSYAKSGNNLDVIWIVKIDWDHMDLADVDMKQFVIDSLSQSDTNWYESNYNVETRVDYSLGPSLSDDRGDINTNDLQCDGTVVYYGSSLSPLANETDIWVIHDVSGSWSTNVDSGGAFTITSITSSAIVRQNLYTIKVVEDGSGAGGNDLYYTSSATESFITDQIEFFQSGVGDSRIDVNDAGYIWWRARYDYDDTEIVGSLTAQLNGSKALTWNSTYSRWQYQESIAIVSQIGYSILSASESGYGLTIWKQTTTNVSLIWDQIVVRSYSVSDSRVNINELADINVTLEYEYDDTPVTDGIAAINLVLATHLGSGIWRITETSSSVQASTYDIVACSGNAHGITVVDQNSQNVSIIWDKVTVRSYSVGDSRVNVNDTVTIDVTLEYEYDDTPVVDGSVEINLISASHQGGGVWRITQSSSTVQGILYDSVVSSGNTLGISAVDQNGQSQLVIWDQVAVQSYTASDNRVNINDNINLDLSLEYEYDGSPLVDGSVTINSIPAIHTGGGVWRITDSKPTIQEVIYDTVACSGNLHNITSVNQNGQSQQIIWDTVVVRLYSVLDSRVDLVELVSISVTLEYDFDDTPLLDGLVTINSISATNLGAGVWNISVSRSSVANVTYDTVACLGNTYGITFVDQNSQSQSVIWDKITVRSYSVVDDRVNVNDTVNIDVTIEYEYDDSPVVDGAVTIDGIVALHQGSGVWRISQSKDSVLDVTYSTVGCAGNAYGLSVVDQSGQSQTVIWDQVLVQSLDVFDPRISVNASVNIDVTLVYKYDTTPVLDGSVNISGLSATHTGGGIWRLTDSKSSVLAFIYDTLSCLGNDHGITNIDQNGKSVQVIWDQVVVRSLSADDSRVNVSDTVTINFVLEYEYDDSPLIDGTVTLNSLSAIHQGAGVWQITQMKTSVVGVTYDSVACVGNTYGITSVDQNSQSLTVIWDEMVVRSYSASDSRTNINDTVYIDVSIEYEYDDSPVLDGTVTINGILAAHQGGGLWRIFQSKDTVQGSTYDSVTCTGNTHGISTINQNGQSQLVVWDRIVVQSYSVLDDRVNIDESVNIDFTLIYDYDNSPVTDGVVEVNSIVATHQGGGLWRAIDTKSTVQSFVYNNASCSGNSHGITTVDQNGKSKQVIWDQVLVVSYTIDDARINIGTSVVLNVTLRYKYDATSVNSGVVIVNSLSATNLGNGVWQISELMSSVQSKIYQTVICSGNLYGITSVDQDSQQLTVIWDQITVRGYSVSDDRVDINAAVSINVTLEYEYDDTPVIDGVTTINGNAATHVGSGDWRILVSRSSVQLVTFDLVVCSGNQHGIDSVAQNLQQQEVIWDQVVVRFYLVLDARVNVNVTVNVDVTLEYEYDDTAVTDGSAFVNGVAAVHLEGGIWRISVVESSVTDNLYDSVSVSGNYFGIVDVDQNGKSEQVVWDQVIVRSLTASDPRHNVGGTITVLASLGYAYDASNLTDGFVIINSISFSYSGANGIWVADRTKSVVSDETFDSVLVSGNSEGISSVVQNGQQVTIIWDRIRILTTIATDSRTDIGSNSTIIVSAQLEYDGHPLGLGDTIFVNDTAMNWDSLNSWFYLNRSNSAAGLWTYYANTTGAFESTFGISAINTMGLKQAVIWDRLVVTISSDASAVFDLTQVNFSINVIFEYDGLSCTSYTLQIGKNLTSWKAFNFANLSMFIDSNMNVTYQYSTLGVVAESAFDISAFITNNVNVTWSIPSNYDPINASPPRLLNPDDSDSLYSRYRFYMIETYLIDYDGFFDIMYAELSLWDNSRATEIWRVRFTFSNSSFSIVHGEQFIELAAWSTSIGLGSEANITWVIKTDWDHPDVQDVDVKQYVFDNSSASDTDWFESDWDFESRLDYSTVPSLSDDRGDPDTADLQASGTVTYVGSSLHPLSNETDVWIVHDFSGTWSGDCNLAGVFSIVGIGSSSDVRLNIYTFKIVEAGGGPASTDLYYTLSVTDSFITDRIEFYLSGVVDPRIDINSPGHVWWSARYAYDGFEIQGDLTAFLNGSKTLVWDIPATRWFYQETRNSPQKVGYRVTGATESTYGLTAFSQTASDQSIIWDSLTVIITGPFDPRINVNTNASEIYATAFYNYDYSQYDGTLVFNNTVFQYSTVQRQYYTIAFAFGGTHNITIITVNDLAWCIWDQIDVVSINTNATYLDPGEYVRIQVYMRYDFDDADVDAGQFSLKFEDLQYVDDGIWECNITRYAYQSLLLDTLTTCNATGLGITSFVMNSVSRIVYWDRLEFYVSSTVENRIDVDSTGFTFWGVRLESSGIDVTAGLVSQITGSVNLTYLNDLWQSSHIFHDVGQRTFAVEYAKLGGIDFFIQSASDVTLVWDRIVVLTTSATLVNPEIDEFIQIRATLAYEYDGVEVTDGVVSLWDEGGHIAMNYNSTGSYWYTNLTKGVIGVYTFYVVAVSGNTHGITVLVAGGNAVNVEFREPVLPRMTPLTLGIMVGGFSFIALILAILVRRRYHVIVPYLVTQILNAIEAIKQGEPVDIDVRPLQRMIFDELELGYIEAGLDAPEILFQSETTLAESTEVETIESASPEDLLFDDLEPVSLKLEGELEIVESGESETEIPIPELDEGVEIDETLAVEEEEISHAEAEAVIDKQPELQESTEIAVEPEIDTSVDSTDSSTLAEETAKQYVDLDASATVVTSEAISRILEDPSEMEEEIVERIPLTKSDWIEAMPQHIMQYFFEEELKELEIDELQQLSLMTQEEIESLVEATSTARGSDSFVPETSGADISDALRAQKGQFDEILGDDQMFKTRMLELIPAFIREFFTDDLLMQLSREELEQISRYSQPDLQAMLSHFSMKEDPIE